MNRGALTFTVSASLTLEAASSAARQGSAVVSAQLVRFDFQLLGLARSSSRARVPSVIRVQVSELVAFAAACRVVTVASSAQFGLSQQLLRDFHRERAAGGAVR